MDIDKEIEELEKIIVDRLDTARAYCGNQICDAGRWVAEGIVPKYRKADEVRKETAKEILFALLDKKFKMDDNGRVCIVDIYDELNRLFEKYGVEVDE